MANKLTGDKPGPGRPKGSVNKVPALLKEAIIKAAEQVGSDGRGKGSLTGYCVFLAKSEPKAFAALLGRVLPMQLTGPDGEDGEPTAIEMRIVRPKR